MYLITKQPKVLIPSSAKILTRENRNEKRHDKSIVYVSESVQHCGKGRSNGSEVGKPGGSK